MTEPWKSIRTIKGLETDDGRTLLPMDCVGCGYQSNERWDNCLRTKAGVWIYKRGIRIVHRCAHIEA